MFWTRKVRECEMSGKNFRISVPELSIALRRKYILVVERLPQGWCNSVLKDRLEGPISYVIKETKHKEKDNHRKVVRLTQTV